MWLMFELSDELFFWYLIRFLFYITVSDEFQAIKTLNCYKHTVTNCDIANSKTKCLTRVVKGNYL